MRLVSRADFSEYVLYTEQIIRDTRLIFGELICDKVISGRVGKGRSNRYFLRNSRKRIELEILDRDSFHREYIPEEELNSGDVAGFARRMDMKGGWPTAFVKEGIYYKIISTIGHEVGHLIGEMDKSKVNEEAKAYAFEYAWGKKLNGMHEDLRLDLFLEYSFGKPGEYVKFKTFYHTKAFNYVKRKVESGMDPMELFRDLSSKKLRVENTLS